MEQWIGSVHSKMAWRTHFFFIWRLSRFGKELFIYICIALSFIMFFSTRRRAAGAWCDMIFFFFFKLGWALFVTYTIIQSIMRSEMCSLHLTHPSVHTWSSGQPTVQRLGSSRGLPAGVGIQTHNLGLPRVSSRTLYPLGQRLPEWSCESSCTVVCCFLRM